MTVRNISKEAHLALKRRAKLSGRSAEAEMRAMVEELVPAKPVKGLGTELHEIAMRFGGWDLKLERDQSPARYPTFE